MQDAAENVMELQSHEVELPRLKQAVAPLVAGIVAEYNPFHKGHAWMIQMLRNAGVETVVCVMSGSFVQRAEPAMMPAHVRAKAAIAGGADLVLRLPAPWAVASAEGFAQGAVGLLAALGCVDLLAFGAENSDIEMLGEVAEVLLVDGFNALVKTQLADGRSYAAARAAAADLILPGAAAVLGQPNNILAVEYCKALQGRVRESLREMLPVGTFAYTLPVPVALPRVGAVHDGAPRDGFASASWLREAVREQGIQALAPWVPAQCLPIYAKAAAMGEMTDSERWEGSMLARLRGRSALDFALHVGAGEGLENRLAAAAKQATTLDELFSSAKTKRFAHSRVRRLALSTALDLPAEPGVVPPFGQILAANQTGIALLRRIKTDALIPVSTSLAKLGRTGPAAAALVKVEGDAEDFYALCQQKPAPGGGAFTRPAYLSAEKMNKA